VYYVRYSIVLTLIQSTDVLKTMSTHKIRIKLKFYVRFLNAWTITLSSFFCIFNYSFFTEMLIYAVSFVLIKINFLYYIYYVFDFLLIIKEITCDIIDILKIILITLWSNSFINKTKLIICNNKKFKLMLHMRRPKLIKTKFSTIRITNIYFNILWCRYHDIFLHFSSVSVSDVLSLVLFNRVNQLNINCLLLSKTKRR